MKLNCEVSLQIVEARAMLTHELKSRNKGKLESDPPASGTSMAEVANSSHEENLSVPSSADLKSAITQPFPGRGTDPTGLTVVQMDKHPVQGDEIQVIDKSVVDEGPSGQTKYQQSYSGSSSRAIDDKYEDDADDWLKEETPEVPEARGTAVQIENDEDVSFSDLEEDDDDVRPSYKKAAYGSDSSTKDSRDWVQLGGSSDDSGKESKDTKVSGRKVEVKESNDWLNLDDIDKI